jgi:hypothetical protein
VPTILTFVLPGHQEMVIGHISVLTFFRLIKIGRQ